MIHARGLRSKIYCHHHVGFSCLDDGKKQVGVFRALLANLFYIRQLVLLIFLFNN